MTDAPSDSTVARPAPGREEPSAETARSSSDQSAAGGVDRAKSAGEELHCTICGLRSCWR